MEVRKQQVTRKRRKRGVKNSFLIKSESDKNWNDVCIEEFENRYELLLWHKNKSRFQILKEEDLNKNKGKYHSEKNGSLDQLELSLILSEFILYHFFCENKPFCLLGMEISLKREDEYITIFQKLNPIYNP